MGDRERFQAVVILEEGDFGGSGARIDDQDVEELVISKERRLVDGFLRCGFAVLHDVRPRFLKSGNYV